MSDHEESVTNASFLHGYNESNEIKDSTISNGEDTISNSDIGTMNGADSDDEDERSLPSCNTQVHNTCTKEPQQPLAQDPSMLFQDGTLCVSRRCKTTICFRIQWEAEMNPRCREKTMLQVADKSYLFDGFYIVCHEEPPSIPQFEYTRDNVMCRIQFIREELPSSLLPNRTSSDTCYSLYLLQRYLFLQLLGIQSIHLFQTLFADPSHSTGDPRDLCSDYHLIPRFLSISPQDALLHASDLYAHHRIGYAVGTLLSIPHILACLTDITKHSVQATIDRVGPRPLIDSIIGTRLNGIPHVFRVDGIKTDDIDFSPTGGSKYEVRLQHIDHGAQEYDGAKSHKRIKKWKELGSTNNGMNRENPHYPFVQVSPRVIATEQVLDPIECHLTGLRTDLFELASAMPMVLKYMRHYKLLSHFEVEMKLGFKDKALLRQAFTHGSYVDVGMQHVNTVEATTSRVRLGHVFENSKDLKRYRNAVFGENEKVDQEIQELSQRHLMTPEFRPEFHSKYCCSYERLEFLGDAVLSFLVASSSFLKMLEANEGTLHQTRVDVANNLTLGRIARCAQFDLLMLTAYDFHMIKDEVKTKIAADCFEALLGAIYKDQGIDACRAFWGHVLIRYDRDLYDLCFLSKQQVSDQATAYIEIDRKRFSEWSRATETRLRHRRFTTETQIVIKTAHLWVQCMTHGSYKGPDIEDNTFLSSDSSYERIEFLGDAVLQLLCSEFLVQVFPYHHEHLLTQARSALVKNKRLAIIAKKAGYESFLRLGKNVQNNGQLYMEDVLADTFEATLGAVYLEHVNDLSFVKTILENKVFPLLQEAIKRREWMNPRKILEHHVTQWNRVNRKPIHCVFKKIAAPQETQHAVVLMMNGYPTARAMGRTIHAAQDAACRRALLQYGLILPSAV